VTLGRPLVWARFVGSRNAGRSRPSQDSPAPARGLYHGQAPRRFASSLRAFRPGFRFHCPDPNFSETKSLKHRNFLGPSLAWARQCQRPKATIDLRAYSVSNVARRCAFPAPNRKSLALCTGSTNAPNAGARRVSLPLSRPPPWLASAGGASTAYG